MTSDLSIETRLCKLEAINAIRHLKYEYAAACDDNYAEDVIAPMFTEDAVWDGGERWGRYDGREAIRKFFSTTADTINFALHLMIGGDIEVSDDLSTATGGWQLFEPVAVQGDDGKYSAIMAGIYADTYRLTDDGWKFSEVRLDWAMQSKLELGWAETRFHI